MSKLVKPAVTPMRKCPTEASHTVASCCLRNESLSDSQGGRDLKRDLEHDLER